MNTTLETIPATWDDERDGQFFRVTAALFPQTFSYGASVLLASYDPADLTHDDVVNVRTPVGARVRPTASSEIAIATDATPHAA